MTTAPVGYFFSCCLNGEISFHFCLRTTRGSKGKSLQIRANPLLDSCLCNRCVHCKIFASTSVSVCRIPTYMQNLRRVASCIVPIGAPLYVETGSAGVKKSHKFQGIDTVSRNSGDWYLTRRSAAGNAPWRCQDQLKLESGPKHQQRYPRT